MKCRECDQLGDWVGRDDHWRPVNEASRHGFRPLLECRACGHQQWFS